ncbi:MAG: TIM barrel protein [Thiobacillus sp.]|uniref:bifunctional sugar phosphate isomerase/epimerase/4-hydroxyphenylpyruvate dioxygenase family protein n=1 Tax=Thiobacillus sp. TaxID=924 RepID=UPI002895979D|nr:TIM barrel protein [Thiobacillus sp.]MDT3707392.1 TIM barrel protein [Thiobacillus sp.]
MLRAISSLSFSGPLEEKIVAAAEAGFSGIEIFREDIVGFDGTPEDIAALAARNGIGVVSLQSLRDFEALPPAERAWAVRRAGRFLDLAARLGAAMLVVCANTRPDALDDPERAAADLGELADMAAARGLRVGYEALASSTHVRSYLEAWEIVKQAARPNLGLVVNAVHSFAADAGLAGLDTVEAERIFLVHIADAPITRIDQRLLTEAFRLLPGQGNLPVADLAARLVRRGYGGPISVEAFNEQLRALKPAQIAKDAMRALDLVEGAGSTGGEVVVDLAFLEIACQGEDARELRGVLAALGFVLTHRAKAGDVTLYRQGEIRLLVNEARSGLARSFYLMQGLGVSALGLRVADAQALAARRDEAEPETEGASYALPLIRGPAGSVFYLLEEALEDSAVFAGTFEAVGAAPPTARLTHVDHFAQALRPNLFLSELLFYRAILGFGSEQQRDVLDPHGTVRSRVVANGNGRVRMSLNSSQEAGTTTRRFLEHSGMAAYHHFAFATDDIFGFARGLPREMVLKIPANYHDDLFLRFDLPAETVAAMRAHGILYDRDEAGEYFQLYTRALNGLFFEIVQRTGYRGLGAANAAVRMLAQTRDYESEHAFDAY